MHPQLIPLLRYLRLTLIAIALSLSTSPLPAAAGEARYVIEISIDGGGAGYLRNLMEQNQLPNFRRLQKEGVWTNNARTDYDYTITLPNHVTMVTGRGVIGVAGHGWLVNVDPAESPRTPDYSLQDNKGSYISSVFDVVHDHGLRTALYTTKSKFILFDHSYNHGNGASDRTGPDNGRNKIDAYVYNPDSRALTAGFITAMGSAPFNYVLLHYADADAAGHAKGWGSSDYDDALKSVDSCLGMIFTLIRDNPLLRGKTEIILTADHGGEGTNHAASNAPLDYTIPFYVWGPDAGAGVDLYRLNRGRRADPGDKRPSYAAPLQPIRNGELANLALKILNLGPVPGSTINRAQDLRISASPATSPQPARSPRRSPSS